MARIASLCVFCGSSDGARPAYREAAAHLARCLHARRIALVYGGGNIGLMGEVSRTLMACGGRVVGVIPQALFDREKGNRSITRLEVVSTMHERKARMAELADAFVALPGGFGTLEEFCEVLTWSQLGLHAKPVALLNVGRYFDPLLALFDHALSEGFLRPENRRLVLVEETPESLLEALARHPGRAFTREQLLVRAFGPDREAQERTLDTHVTNLRKKLERRGGPRYVVTVPGVGYRFARPEELG